MSRSASRHPIRPYEFGLPLRIVIGAIMAALAVPTLVGCTQRVERHAAQTGGPTLPEGQNGRLLAAASLGDIFSVQQLVNQGADIDARASNGTTALMGASYAGYPRTAQFLIARGAQVNAKSADGLTALHYAAGAGYSEIVGSLLDAGADPNAKTAEGVTPLMKAAQAGHEKTVERLVAGGATADASIISPANR